MRRVFLSGLLAGWLLNTVGNYLFSRDSDWYSGPVPTRDGPRDADDVQARGAD